MNNVFIASDIVGNKKILNNTPTDHETRYNLSNMKINLKEKVVLGVDAYEVIEIINIVEWDLKVVFVKWVEDLSDLLIFLEDVGY